MRTTEGVLPPAIMIAGRLLACIALTVVVGGRVAAQQSLSCGVALQQPLASGAVDEYVFSPTSVGPVVVEVLDTSGTIGLLKMHASGPDGVSETCSGTLELADPGGTTITVSDCIGNDTGTYTITSNVVSPNTSYCALPLNCGSTPDGIGFSTPGEVDSYELFPDNGTTATVTATDLSGIGPVRLRAFDQQGALVPGGDSCAGSLNFVASNGPYTILASACDGPRTGHYRITRATTDCPAGPVTTSFLVVNADDTPQSPATFDTAGRPVFVRPTGRGFSLVVEAHPGSDDAAVGTAASNGAGGLTPDLQVLLSRPLGNGSPVVCDITAPMLGGVPATVPFAYANTPAVINAMNDFGCRVSDGVGAHLARTDPLDACTATTAGVFDFIDPTTTTQFCALIQGPWPFLVGDTIVSARVRDHNQTVGAAREIVVRVLQGPPLGPASLVKDIVPGDNGFYDAGTPQDLVAIGNVVYFSAADGISGVELWRSDGSAAGTQLVADILPGPDGSSPNNLVNVNGTLFFVADDGVHGRELWKSDGTVGGTVLVKDLTPGMASSLLQNLTAAGDVLYFTYDDPLTGEELWKSDGTDAGTVLVKDINPGPIGSQPTFLTPFGDALYFSANDGQHGFELWRSDGTDAGTALVSDIDPGPMSSGVSFLTPVGDVLFFNANDGQHGQELWKTDGTTAGTEMVKDIYQGTIPNAGSNPQNLTNVGGTLYFSATTFSEGTELWRSDGTEAGTVLVDDINPSQSSSFPQNLTAVNGVLFFSADDGVHGREIWRSNGSAAGTMLVKDIMPGPASSGASNFINVQGTLLFSASDGSTGIELWRSDGSQVGTTELDDINPGAPSSYPGRFTSASGTVFFVANDGQTGFELWQVPVSAVALSCPGDCNNDGVVTVNELVTAVALALNGGSIAQCAAADRDGNGVITVDELVSAVNSALNGCG